MRDIEKKSPLRFRLLQILAKAHPNEMRFLELYEAAGSPSKSVFSASLRWLTDQKLIIREQVTYRCVVYRLDPEKYREWQNRPGNRA